MCGDFVKYRPLSELETVLNMEAGFICIWLLYNSQEDDLIHNKGEWYNKY